MIIFFTYTQHTFFIIFKIKIYLLSLQFLGTLITLYIQNMFTLKILFLFVSTKLYFIYISTPHQIPYFVLPSVPSIIPTHNLGLIGVVVIFFVVILPLFEKNPTGTLGSFLLILCAL